MLMLSVMHRAHNSYNQSNTYTRIHKIRKMQYIYFANTGKDTKLLKNDTDSDKYLPNFETPQETRSLPALPKTLWDQNHSHWLPYGNIGPIQLSCGHGGHL